MYDTSYNDNTVLTNNVFNFYDSEYIQNDGVAIGSKSHVVICINGTRGWCWVNINRSSIKDKLMMVLDLGSMVLTTIKFRDFANAIHPNIKVELRCDADRNCKTRVQV